MSRAWQGVVGRRFGADDFRAYVRALDFEAWFPHFVVVHNTQIPTLAQWKGKRNIDALVEYYRDEQGWSAGPHLFIEPAGIWIFTPLSTPGVHSPSWNALSWGVEIVGDFDREELSEAHGELVVAALATLHDKMGWLESNIRLHKDDPATTHTSCPGKNIRREELESKLQTLIDLQN